jgi:hypothetical protein
MKFGTVRGYQCRRVSSLILFIGVDLDAGFRNMLWLVEYRDTCGRYQESQNVHNSIANNFGSIRTKQQKQTKRRCVGIIQTSLLPTTKPTVTCICSKMGRCPRSTKSLCTETCRVTRACSPVCLCRLGRAEEAIPHVRCCLYQPRPAFHPVEDRQASVTQSEKRENRAAEAMIMQVRWQPQQARLTVVRGWVSADERPYTYVACAWHWGTSTHLFVMPVVVSSRRHEGSVKGMKAPLPEILAQTCARDAKIRF